MALRRIQKELEDIKNNPSREWDAGPLNESDLFHWQGTIMGPENTPYEGVYFFLNINFPTHYPLEPYKIIFTTRIYHPHINSNGHLHCCEYSELFLKTDPGNWNPSMTIRKGLDLITKSLKNIEVYCDGWNFECASMFLKDRKEFDRIAREWTKKYA